MLPRKLPRRLDFIARRPRGYRHKYFRKTTRRTMEHVARDLSRSRDNLHGMRARRVTLADVVNEAKRDAEESRDCHSESQCAGDTS